MRSVVDGVAYNTLISRAIARLVSADAAWHDRTDSGQYHDAVVYRMPAGHLFLHVETTVRRVDAAGGETEEKQESIEPLTREEAEQWMSAEGVERFDHPRADPSEVIATGAGPPRRAGLFIRLPAALKARIEAQAKVEGVSINTWAIRAFEQTLAASADPTNKGDL